MLIIGAIMRLIFAMVYLSFVTIGILTIMGWLIELVKKFSWE